MSDKKTVIDSLLDNAREFVDTIKKPRIRKRIKRAFESGVDDLDDQIDSVDSTLLELREKLVTSPDDVNDTIQKIINKRLERINLVKTKEELKTELKELF